MSNEYSEPDLFERALEEVVEVYTSKEYNGWKNWNTWNVALWIGNEYPLYQVSRGYRGYATPYLSMRKDLADTFGYIKTKDGVSLWAKDLDIPRLNELIKELWS